MMQSLFQKTQQLQDYYPLIKTEYITQNYYFKYGMYDGHYGESVNIKVNVPKDLYLYYQNQNHIFSGDYSNITSFITPDDIVIADILNQINSYYHNQGLNYFWLMLKLVAEVVYAEDKFSIKGWDEYPKYPVETLVERAGDCEDTTFLMASMLKAMNVPGTEPTLVRFSDHLGLAVLADINNPSKDFLYLETTGETVDEYSFGIMPDVLASREYTLHYFDEYKRVSYNYQVGETKQATTENVTREEKELFTGVDENLMNHVKGKILLQVEKNGEGWYVSPGDSKKYYLGRPADAFSIMRELGLGISEINYNSYNGYAPSNLSGKILLRVEANGEAYYVNPSDLKMYYLGRPADAFEIMRELGLGITNSDIRKIDVGELE